MVGWWFLLLVNVGGKILLMEIILRQLRLVVNPIFFPGSMMFYASQVGGDFFHQLYHTP